ncbi:S41 family peptidase [Polaribacter porphyrae]|uniref:CBM20 domain-containing protein n=1 Tax=Polaribacter porphyrae TaxID=1137780 RepID=A0A2S7WNA7_9FLAO|nr:S41 family peptidase [Polaribacter porphyrae]PQJ79095.1 hypothetical protein BTO18_07900 [Polaribacter porphyrae]
MKKKSLLKYIFCYVFFSCNTQEKLTLSLHEIPKVNQDFIGVRGNFNPLSWDKTTFLQKDNDRYTVTINSKEINIKNLEYKYVIDDGNTVTWEQIPNRLIQLDNKNQYIKDVWNKEKIIDINSLNKISVEQLNEDFKILKEAILKIHPGIYRYNDSITLVKNFKKLENKFQKPQTYSETYITISKLISTIKCDHTLASYWNQEPLINAILHKQKNKIPFTFKWVNRKMVVTHSVSNSEKIKMGSTIVAINNIETEKILKELTKYISADGNTMHNRVSKTEVDGYNFRFNSFDVLFPLVFNIKNKIEIELSSGERIKINLLTLEERFEKLTKKYSDFPKSPQDLWDFKIVNKDYAYLKIGSFSTNRFSIDWKSFLKNSFKTLSDNKIKNLIIDIRENQGGMDEASKELEKFLVKKTSIEDQFEGRTRFINFPNNIKKILQNQNAWYYNLREENSIKENSYFIFPKMFAKKPTQNYENSFKGNAYLLTGPKNVSAAFYLAKLFKDHKIGKVIGSETGGNQNGINGGSIIFLKLPNSRINIDMPVAGSFSKDTKYNGGIIPDISIKTSEQTKNNEIDFIIKEIKSNVQ